MKLKNKQTGEIIEVESLDVDTPTEGVVGIPSFDRKGNYNSLAQLNAEWEDYEEPKEYWFLSGRGEVRRTEDDGVKFDKDHKQIGNYFETEEEAELTVRKLKAWKRLKDKGFEFINFPYKKICKYDARTGVGNLEYQVKYYEELESDLDACFGGEE